MRVGIGCHGVDKTKVIGQFSQARKHVGDHLAGLAARLEFPERLGQRAVCALEGHEFLAAGQRLAMPLDQLGFEIPRVQMT